MKRALLLSLLAALVAPAAAIAHPLGNFTTNTFTRIEPSGDRLYVLYVLDLAEIPTYQARAERARLGRAEYAATTARRLAAKLTLSVDGRPRPLHELGHALSLEPGAGGLRTTRLEIVLDAGTAPVGTPLRLDYADRNFPGRIGWREVVARGTNGARIDSASVPSRSVSDELRSYPAGLLQSPLDVTAARLTADLGSAAGVPPVAGEEPAGPEASADGFSSLVDDDLGFGVVLVALLAAMFWGAAHALTPGHGKAIVAAYMVGTRGTARHAFLLGGIVTFTHTIGVFALGLVTLALSEFIVPEQLYPWLNLASALLVVAVGVTVLRYRILAWWRGRTHEQAHRHDHHHHHGPGGHSHAPEPGSGLRGLVAVGVSGGILPCPTALVVLLAAISLHRIGYGLVLILAFSVGLASVVTGIGLLAVGSRRLFNRVSLDGRVVRALPAASAVVIVALGFAMTVRALPALV